MISYMPLMRTLDKKGISLLALSKRIGAKSNSLNSSLSQNCQLKISTLMKIAEVLEVGIEDLISWQEGEGDNIPKYVGVNWQKLSDICKDNNTTLTALSVNLGHSKGNFTNIRSQNGKLSPIDVEKICEVLNVSKEQFVL